MISPSHHYIFTVLHSHLLQEMNHAVLHSFQCLPFTLLPHHLLLTQKEHFLRLWSRTTSIQLVAFSFLFFFWIEKLLQEKQYQHS